MNKLYALLEEWAPAALLAAMTVIVIVDVSGRYVLNFTVPGAAEFATTLFVWLVFLGSAGAARKFQHISIDTLTRHLPRRLLPALHASMSLIILAASLYVVWLGVELATSSWDREIEVLHIPYFYVYIVIPISFGLIAVHSTTQIVDILRHGDAAAALRNAPATDLDI